MVPKEQSGGVVLTMSITEIKDGNLLLARYIPADDAWKDGLNFFSSEGDFVQVGTWRYSAGKELKAHIHNEFPREAMRTQEVLYIRRGRIQAHIYNMKEVKIAEIVASEGDILVMLSGGHGYDILTDGTEVVEVKNGPYSGPDRDRRRI